MNRLSPERRAAVVHALCEGTSIRGTCRLTGTAKGTVLRILEEAGTVALAYQRERLTKLACKKIQCDEVWSFIGAKKKNASPYDQMTGRRGDVWTWTSICADTKLVPCWHVGKRDADAAAYFMEDVASRLAHRVQLTTDMHRPYLQAVEGAFGWNGVDYAMLLKIYGRSSDREGRYSPPTITGTEKHWIMGNPDKNEVSTSYVERANLTMRMQMRRFTRLTNAFSRKLENHLHAVSLHFLYYNFVRPHQTLTKAAGGVHTTPAMAAGISDHVWKVSEIVKLMDERAVSSSN